MERDDAVLEEEDDEVSIVLNTCKLVYCLFSLFTSCVICVHLITQEGEVEYVEGDDMEEIGDMEDMEDFGGLSDGKRCFAETSTSLTGLLYFILNFLDPLVCARSHKHYSQCNFL